MVAHQESNERPAVRLEDLPAAVRARVVALASDAVGALSVEVVPPALKKVVSFTPARRARLAGDRIIDRLVADESFREVVAHQVVAGRSSRSGEGTDREELDEAAVLFLSRPEGWVDRLLAYVDGLAERETALTERQVEQRASRLEAQVERLQEELARQRSEHREQVAGVRQENADLRRKLGETRVQLKSARSEAESAASAAAEAGSRAAADAATAEREIRRLRSRIAELERESADTRRVERSGREGELLRARLLLDTVVEAAQGLRRELALPVVEGSPADSVRADQGVEGQRTSSGHGSLAVGDPALLDQLVRLPRTHLIVDGYNVSKSAWPALSLERQRDALLSGLSPLAARSGAEITVVFDAAETRDRPLVKAPRNVRVLFSPYGVIADDVIRDLVAAEPAGRPLLVVTSDQAVSRDVTARGARVVASAGLSGLLALRR